MEHIVNDSEALPSRAASIHWNESLTPSKIISPVSHERPLLLSSNSELPLPLWKQETQSLPVHTRKFANPAPLGLCAFALTSFLSNCINLNVGYVQAAGVSVSLALNYGGITQVLAGMWEMAVGNTLGATTFTSFGAYWITFALISTFENPDATKDTTNTTCQNETLMGLFMLAWFIFTTLMLLCTLKSSLAMFALFFFLDLNYLLLGIAHIQCNSRGEVLIAVQKTGGICGLLAAFAAWYNAFAGVCDSSTGFFTVPLGHFPWSPAAHVHRLKAKEV